jgi:hypothetical protein
MPKLNKTEKEYLIKRATGLLQKHIVRVDRPESANLFLKNNPDKIPTKAFRTPKKIIEYVGKHGYHANLDEIFDASKIPEFVAREKQYKKESAAAKKVNDVVYAKIQEITDEIQLGTQGVEVLKHLASWAPSL